MPTKKWYQSKTLWFNFLSAAIVMVQDLAGVNAISNELAVQAVIVGNAVLRLITKDSIGA